jgi:hypothetical protein
MKEEKLTANEQTIVDLWNAKTLSEVEKILADYKKREAEEVKK